VIWTKPHKNEINALRGGTNEQRQDFANSDKFLVNADFLFLLKAIFFSNFFFWEWSLTKSYPTMHCPTLFLTTLSSYSREDAHHKLARSHTNHALSFTHDSYFREEA
jgi:hypothetical protein